VVAAPLCVERAFPLVQACWQVGAPQIRNRGTLAGNLITASPANDSITPLWAMDGQVTLTSLRGERRLAFSDFFQGVRKTDLRADEMLTDVAFRPLHARQRGTFLKLGLRSAQAVSVVNVALVLGFAETNGHPTGRVTEAHITLGSVAPTIVRAGEAEQALVGQPLSDRSIQLAAEQVALAARPISDVRGSAEYRQYMLGVYVRRGLQQLRAGAERAGSPTQPVMLWGKAGGRFPSWPEDRSAPPPLVVHARDGEQAIETTVNGRIYRVRGGNGSTLLRLLRQDIGLTGTKEGCAEGECGACTVLLDGIAVMSCLVPAPRAHGSRIVTIEGLGTPGALHPLQQAFVDRGAVQCGYCTPGFIMSAASLLEEKPAPNQDEIRQALTGNLCRCTGYYSIISAIEQAVGTLRADS
jgi:carbon-monoxide dehydrogenase medium subunit